MRKVRDYPSIASNSHFDNNSIIHSRPIMGYLVSKYAKNDSLYPKDPKKRGMVDQMLYFDIGTLNENVIKCYVRISFPFLYSYIFFFFFLNTMIFPQYSAIFLGAHSLNEENVRAVERSCEVLNAYLNDREYVAGDTLTIADFAIHTTICVLLVSSFHAIRNYLLYLILSALHVSVM